MSTLADRSIAALRANHDDLAARVRALDDANLGRQSGAAEWDVAEVLSHLGSGAEIMLATLESAQAGAPAPGQDVNQPIWDRWNAMSARDKADGFVEANEKLVTALEGLDETARREVRVKLSFIPSPIDIATFAGMRLTEAALHGWDVRVAFDPEAGLPGVEAGVALEQFAGALGFMLGFLGRPDALAGVRGTARIELADPDRALGLKLGDGIELARPPEQAAAVVTGPAESFVRLLYGRLGTVRTSETLTVDGDLVTLDQLRAVFAGI